MYRVNMNIEIRQIGTQYMVKDVTNELVHVLDDIAGEILLYLQDGYTVNEIVDGLIQKYEGAEKISVYDDVVELIENFKNLGIVVQ